MSRLTVVVGIVIGVAVRLVATGGGCVVSAVIAVALPRMVGECFMAGWVGDVPGCWCRSWSSRVQN